MESQENRPSLLLAVLGKAKKFIDRVLIFSAISIWIFTIVMIVIFIREGSVPDTLIDRFFGVFGIEGILCAVLTIAKQFITKVFSSGEEEDTDVSEDDEDLAG